MKNLFYFLLMFISVQTQAQLSVENIGDVYHDPPKVNFSSLPADVQDSFLLQTHFVENPMFEGCFNYEHFSDELKAKLNGNYVDANTIVFPAFTQTKNITMLNCEFLNTKNIHVKHGESLRQSSAEKKRWIKKREDYFRAYSDDVARYLTGNFNSDVLVLTEVGDADDVDVLYQLLKKYDNEYQFYAVAQSRDTYTGQNVAIISKSKITTIEHQILDKEHYVSEPDDSGDDAPAATISKGGIFDVAFGDFDVRFIVAHLISERSGAESDAKRLAQANIIRRIALNQDNQNIIICGDMNDAKGQPPILRMRGFDDIFPTYYTAGDTKHFNDNSQRYTYTYQGVNQMIDHFLLSPNLMQRLKSRSGLQAETKETPEQVSDHRAYTITLKFNQ